MTGACFPTDNSILMKRSFLWDLLERVSSAADIRSVVESASDNIVYTEETKRERERHPLCDPAKLEILNFGVNRRVFELRYGEC